MMVSDEKGGSFTKTHDSVSSKLLSLNCSFSGFWHSDSQYVSWLAKMEALYEPIWRKAGIFEAIKASTFNIIRNQTLILSVSEKWCSHTKSFIFPFGEATITLEDVMVLLGFSVLGSSPLESESLEMRDSVELLRNVRLEITKRDRCVRQNAWVSSFLGRGDQIEHQAFLVLWLSLFVYPGSSRRYVSGDVIPIAVRLARGERIALAPTVLANIYQDLDCIHGLATRRFDDDDDDDKVHFKSLFKLVQLWTWERFKSLRPKAREIPKGEPRIAQWDSLQQRLKNVKLSFDEFEWRPYTQPLKNWSPFRLYVEEAMWLSVDDSVDEEFVSFSRCVRVSHLVGDGFVQGYYPNRVVRQFGLTQDLPDSITYRRDLTEKEAWDHYSKSLDGEKLYVPSRLDRGYVTTRYRDLWLQSVSEFLSSEEAKKESIQGLHDDDDDDDDLDVSLKVLPLSKVVQRLEKGFPAKLRRSRTCRLAKRYKERASEDDDESLDDSITIAQRIRSRKKYYSDAEETSGDDCKSFGQRRRKFQVEDSDDSESCQKFSSVKVEQRSEDDDEIASRELKTVQVCVEEEVDVSASKAEKKTIADDGTKEAESWLHEVGERQRSNDDDYDERWKQRKLAIDELALNLESRMTKVEKTLEMIRKWKTRRNQIQAQVSA